MSRSRISWYWMSTWLWLWIDYAVKLGGTIEKDELAIVTECGLADMRRYDADELLNYVAKWLRNIALESIIDSRVLISEVKNKLKSRGGLFPTISNSWLIFQTVRNITTVTNSDSILQYRREEALPLEVPLELHRTVIFIWHWMYSYPCPDCCSLRSCAKDTIYEFHYLSECASHV